MRADLEYHPLSNVFPMMGPDEMEQLAGSIRANGYDPAEPIVLYEGKVLDGRNRHAACLIAGAEPTFDEYRGGSPVAFVVQRNLHRRHLSESQRAMVAAKLAKLTKGRPKLNASIEAFSQEQAADAVNVGRASVQRAAKVQKQAEPEVVAAVEAGNLSVSDAADLADEPPDVQRQAVEAVRNGKARTARQATAETEAVPAADQPAPEPLRDELGIPVPDALAEVFHQREKFQEARRLARQLGQLMDEICKGPAGTFLRKEMQFYRQGERESWRHEKLKDVATDLKFAEPYACVCPYCHHDHPGKTSRKCPACHGAGWVVSKTAGPHGKTPPEYLEAIKGLAQ